jgi:curved DNA-binding protein
VRLSGQAGGADLYLKIKVLPHETFTRKGDDLFTTVPVDLYTAILGGEVSVETLGKPVRLTIPEGTDSGKTLRLKGLGMPDLKNPSKHGDLYARIEVHLPEHLTPIEKEKFREIRNMRHA